jgi:hypothetical protein
MAINLKSGDKTAIKVNKNFFELVEEGKITPNGANKNRTYSLKKK